MGKLMILIWICILGLNSLVKLKQFDKDASGDHIIAVNNNKTAANLSFSESLEEDSEYLIANSSESLSGDSDGGNKRDYVGEQINFGGVYFQIDRKF